VSRRASAGFTLVELLVAITILGVISVAIAATATVLLRATGDTQTRLTESRGPKLVGVYWTPDVNSADFVNPGPVCATGGTALVTFQKSEPGAGSDVAALTTWATVPSADGTSLVRARCRTDALGDPTVSTIAPGVAPATTAVRCAATGSSSFGPCTTLSTPRRVALDLFTGDGRAYVVESTRKVQVS
jgi:prepilin-type N-terminal cleavage/methylation domain-containing protein